jgi:hypothetical protein
MTRQAVYGVAALFGLALIVGHARASEPIQTTSDRDKEADPIVFQAAGPTAASIQSMVDAFRAALGGMNNGNTAGPLPAGRREINWDGGGATTTALVPTPFDGFLVTRGGRFTTRGSGFVQAPVDGLATTFGNDSYLTIFRAFSPVRLFSPIDSNLTTARFFVPGGGEFRATTSGFGAVFSDVDQAKTDDDHDRGDRRDRFREPAITTISFYGARGSLLFKAVVPASKGEASFSFVGVLFDDARVATVRIQTGNSAPGPNDSARRDIVMMDDFLYGEPQMLDLTHPLRSTETPDDN